MIPAENMRRVEIRVDGVWTAASFGQIEAGDTYRMFEGDNKDEPVRGGDGATEFTALAQPAIKNKFIADVEQDLTTT